MLYPAWRSPRIKRWQLRKQLACNEIFHDFCRSTVDALHARICVQTRDGVLDHVAVTAEELQALVGHLALLLRTPPLGHVRGLIVQGPIEQALHTVVYEASHHVCDRGAFCKLEARVLKIRH